MDIRHFPEVFEKAKITVNTVLNGPIMVTKQFKDDPRLYNVVLNGWCHEGYNT